MNGSQRLAQCVVMVEDSIKTGNMGLNELQNQGDKLRLIQTQLDDNITPNMNQAHQNITNMEVRERRNKIIKIAIVVVGIIVIICLIILNIIKNENNKH